MRTAASIALCLLGWAALASCRNDDKPVPRVPGVPTADAGPEQDLDGGAAPIGPIAGGGSGRDAASDGPGN